MNIELTWSMIISEYNKPSLYLVFLQMQVVISADIIFISNI